MEYNQVFRVCCEVKGSSLELMLELQCEVVALQFHNVQTWLQPKMLPLQLLARNARHFELDADFDFASLELQLFLHVVVEVHYADILQECNLKIVRWNFVVEPKPEADPA